MKYSISDISFILYNNRSIKGVVSNFFDKDMNPYRLMQIEDEFERIKSLYKDNRIVNIDLSEIDIDADDVILKPSDLYEITDVILTNVGSFSEDEYNYLAERGIGEQTILEWKMLGLSSITDKDILTKIGATVHPILRKFLDDGVENGGIIIPLFENGKLVNCAIRKLKINTDRLQENHKGSKTLKYTLACPDVPVWGLDDVDGEIWIAEGIFDMIAIRKIGKKAVSCSSAMWSGIQLYKILKLKPKKIVIVADNDSVGFRVSSQLKDLFDFYNIDTKIVHSPFAKDAAEHYFQKHKEIESFEEIEITKDMINNELDDEFDFISYLKNRDF